MQRECDKLQSEDGTTRCSTIMKMHEGNANVHRYAWSNISNTYFSNFSFPTACLGEVMYHIVP